MLRGASCPPTDRLTDITALLRRVHNDEEGARLDFETAARLGNPLAKREAVKMNPYAQLCNQMVAVAMKAHLEQQD